MQTFTVFLILVLASCAHATGSGAPAPWATALEPLEPAFRTPVIEVLESQPVQFVAVFEQQMPTPGWKTVIDSVEVEGDRIVVEITAKAPEGIVAQVITKAKVRVPLGSLRAGRYVLELRTRRADDQSYRVVHALVVNAS